MGWPHGSTNVTVRPVALTTADCTITPGTWWHVAVVTDPCSTQSLLYINGAVVARAVEAPALARQFVNPLRIGTWYEANQAFRGWVDEVKVYDYARTAGQVKASSAARRTHGQP